MQYNSRRKGKNNKPREAGRQWERIESKDHTVIVKFRERQERERCKKCIRDLDKKKGGKVQRIKLFLKMSQHSLLPNTNIPCNYL